MLYNLSRPKIFEAITIKAPEYSRRAVTQATLPVELYL